ncbi:NFU1 iron-sulfur cluster scaffold homolog, mitochondrial [Azospirillaceae bacterium]
MFIQTEQTPNPNTLKFLPGRAILSNGSLEFSSAEAATGRSPLAERLFGVEGVENVFLGNDFIAVTHRPNEDWTLLKTQVLAALMEHFTSNSPVLSNNASTEANADASEGADGSESEDADAYIIQQINELLDSRIRPAVARDGGDITFHSYDNGVVYLRLRGACSGCPSATATLKNGVENLLKYFIPEVTEVRAVR